METIFEKYRFALVDGLHIYDVNLFERDYSMESSTPYLFSMYGKDYTKHAWKNFLPEIVDDLFALYPEKEKDALAFRYSWSKKLVFSDKSKSNSMLLKNGLYLDCNNTATHSVWELQDLLNFFGVDLSEVTLKIHRPCGAECREVREYFLKENKDIFRKLLLQIYHYPDERIDKIIDNIDFFCSKLLMKFSKSYDNFFLFDSKVVFKSYSAKVIEHTEKYYFENPKTITKVKRYMSFLDKLYQTIL